MKKRNKKFKNKKINIESSINRIICDHNIRAMRKFPDNSIDSIITDPPYGLEFMGKEWDKLWRQKKLSPKQQEVTHWQSISPRWVDVTPNEWRQLQHWHYRWAKECLRVAKPGAFLLCFGGTRTFHRLTCAIEDAGWQIRDCLMWLYSTGFPKSLNIGKAIQKLAEKELRKQGVKGDIEWK